MVTSNIDERSVVSRIRTRLADGPSYSLRLCSGSAGVEVISDDRAVTWYVWSYLHYANVGAPARWRVVAVLRDDPDAAAIRAKLARHGTEEHLEYSVNGTVLTSDDGVRIVENQRTGTLTLVDHLSHTCVMFGRGAPQDLFIDVYKAARQLIEHQLMSQGQYAALHASAIAYAGQGMAFLGPKGSGKTTTMLAALTEWGPRAAFISNDGPRIGPGTEGDLSLWSMPTAVGIGMGTIKKFQDRMPRLTEAALEALGDTRDHVLDLKVPWETMRALPGMTFDQARLETDKAWITPRELGYLTGAELAAGLPFVAAFAPTMYENWTGPPRLDRMGPEEAAAVWRANLVWRSRWYGDWLGLGIGTRPQNPDAWTEALRRVPMWRISMGYDTEHVPDAILAKL